MSEKRRMIILPGEDTFPCDAGHSHATPRDAERCERNRSDRANGRSGHAILAAFRTAQAREEEAGK